VELAERFAGLTAVDLDTGLQQDFTAEACRFGYRDSVFKQPGGERWLILSLRLRAGPQFAPVLSYAPLAAAFSGHAGAPSAAAVEPAAMALSSCAASRPPCVSCRSSCVP
jgi:UDP-N-acetylmuramate dehydrogenase